MPQVDLISKIHKATSRNYLQRVLDADKADCAAVSKRFDREYFDGDRKHGYGGYRYDGRWRPFAEILIERYKLKKGDRVLDVGCGKGFLVYDLISLLPGLEVSGLEVSSYAIENAKEEVKSNLQIGTALSLPFPDKSFDLVLAVNVFHNFRIYDLELALRESERVGRKNKYIVNDSYRTEREKVNLMYWQLTCECFYTPDEWKWIFDRCGYRGDYDFVFFE
jgi:protein-L-isoaspartate(D-aspartate) O-methyltransferase